MKRTIEDVTIYWRWRWRWRWLWWWCYGRFSVSVDMDGHSILVFNTLLLNMLIEHIFLFLFGFIVYSFLLFWCTFEMHRIFLYTGTQHRLLASNRNQMRERKSSFRWWWWLSIFRSMMRLTIVFLYTITINFLWQRIRTWHRSTCTHTLTHSNHSKQFNSCWNFRINQTVYRHSFISH